MDQAIANVQRQRDQGAKGSCHFCGRLIKRINPNLHLPSRGIMFCSDWCYTNDVSWFVQINRPLPASPDPTDGRGWLSGVTAL